MPKDQVRAMQFDRKIIIQKPGTHIDDGQGGNSASWVDAYTCRADMQNFPHGRGLFRKFMFQQLYPQTNTIIQIRFQRTVQIDATMRVVYVAHGITHIYKILGVENPSEANVSMFLLCQESQAKAVN